MSLRSLIAAFLVAVPLGLPQASPIDLPDIGDSASATIPPEQQRRIGREMMRSLRESQRVIDDPELTLYINTLGDSLVSSSGAAGEPFEFFVVDSPEINAFAMPGGYIGINSGLVLASRSESELAAVTAHEIAHITQHHLARSFEKANQMNLPMTAAVIAAIILGSQDPQAGQAALAATIAGSTQMQLDFSRSNEQEADRVGIQILSRAGYEPLAMAGFFERLQQQTRYYTSPPEFLSTHPVTPSRIADALNRAELSRQSDPKPDSEAYKLAKAKLRVLNAGDRESLAARLAAGLKSKRGGDQELDRYSLALVLMLLGEHAEAASHLKVLLDNEPGKIAYRSALASALVGAGQFTKALGIYEKGLELYPGNLPLSLGYAETLLAARRHKQAQKFLTQLVRREPRSAKAQQLLGEAEGKLGNTYASHLALAEYYYLTDQVHGAIEQLEFALRSEGIDFYHASRIEARLRQLKEEAALAVSQ